jgi:uncharacterized membrane protein (UPF0136 family)
MAVPMSHQLAAGVTAVYGLAAIAGGVIGYLNAQSVPSLAAGGASGLLLLLSAALFPRRVLWAVLLGGIVSLALIGRFAPDVYAHQADLTDFARTTKGGFALLLVAGGLVTILADVAAIWTRRRAERPAE